MTIRASPRALLVGSALYAIATGTLLLLFKTPVVLPTLQWLRGLSAAQLDGYLSIVARGCIAIGAVTLLAVIVLTRVRRMADERAPDRERK